MNFENINWEQRTELYIFIADKYIKFGITTDWAKRERQYRKNELVDLDFKKYKGDFYDRRWKAELIEQIMKWRLRDWAAPGRHEWVIGLTLLNVVDCYKQIVKEIEPEFDKYEYIHNRGEKRWDEYKQIAQYYFEKQ